MPAGDPKQAQWYADEIAPHESMLRGWLLNRFQLRDTVDDILQETFLRAIKARDRGVLHAPKAFLFTTARNLAIDYKRKSRNFGSEVLVEFDASSVAGTERPAPECVSREQEFALLRQAIETLPPRCREIFHMRQMEGISQREIAKKLGLSTRTVSAQLSIGLRKCPEFFEAYEGELGYFDKE